jgi:hypothetical protein
MTFAQWDTIFSFWKLLIVTLHIMYCINAVSLKAELSNVMALRVGNSNNNKQKQKSQYIFSVTKKNLQENLEAYS